MSPAIEIEDVSFSYGASPVLEHVTLRVQRGEFLGLVGPNAGGKTTLLKLVLGLLQPTAGSLRVLGGPPRERRRRIGYCPQYPVFSRDFPITVEDAVLLGRLGITRGPGYSSADRAAAERAMKAVEVSDIRRRRVGTLSGGQLQRVLIARALAGEPEILILDEPTANVDLRGGVDIFALLKRLGGDITIVVVSHDIGFISEYVDRVACLNRTLVCHSTAELTGEVIERLYGSHVSMIRHTH